nr:gamma carbonic anhydrase family protein [uncultured Cellulosilyticum sp.]
MIKGFKAFKPQIATSAFIAENSTIIGEVTIGEDCSIWYGAVLRGDESLIQIGARSNVQDNCVLHGSKAYPTIIGEGVTIGHGAIVHGATIGDYTLVGMGSTILDGAKIGKNCVIGANSLVTGKTEIGDGMMILGSPARAFKKLTEEEIENLYMSAQHYVDISKLYEEEK